MSLHISKHLLFFSFLLLLLSCRKDQYEIDVPSYIQIDSFLVSDECYESQPNRLVVNNHKAKDVWIYVDGVLQGAYEIPVRFPVNTTGSHEIEVRPGIIKNGISSTRAIYPFYEFYKTTVNLGADETTNITPCLAYLNEGQALGELEVAWSEDFESIIDLDYNIQTDTVVEPVSGDDVIQGNFAGGVFLTSKHDFFEMISPTLTDLPTNGTPIYLELNYRTNHDFFVGLYLSDFSEQINLYGFRANDSWNKVYIDLSEPIRFNGNSTNFNIFLGFQKDPDIENVRLFLDNIKLLHF